MSTSVLNDLKTNVIFTASSTINSAKGVYKQNVQPVLSTVIQFAMWYVTFHTIYWSVEQLRFMWCIPCGFSGYIHSLVVSQSLVCRLLTETSKAMSNHQLSYITMLSSFIGLKCIKYVRVRDSIEESKKENQKEPEKEKQKEETS